LSRYRQQLGFEPFDDPDERRKTTHRSSLTAMAEFVTSSPSLVVNDQIRAGLTGREARRRAEHARLLRVRIGRHEP
jgi:hypothetical protein